MTATNIEKPTAPNAGAASDAKQAERKADQADQERRAASLCWVLSPDFPLFFAKMFDGQKLSRPRRIVLAVLAWYGQREPGTGQNYAWPTVEDLVARTGLSRSAVHAALKWVREDLNLGGRPKPAPPLLQSVLDVCKAVGSGTWEKTLEETYDARKPGAKKAKWEIRKVRKPHAECNALVAKLSAVSAARSIDIGIAAQVSVEAAQFASFVGKNAPPQLENALNCLNEAIDRFWNNHGVVSKRAAGPTYWCFRCPKDDESKFARRSAIYAWAKELSLDDGARLALHAILCRTSNKLGSVWTPDETLAADVGMSHSAFKRGLTKLRSAGFVRTKTHSPGSALPNGQPTTTWRTSHSIDWKKLAPKSSERGPSADQSGSISEPEGSISGPEWVQVGTKNLSDCLSENQKERVFESGLKRLILLARTRGESTFTTRSKP